MALTRNLYDMDEVESALLLSLMPTSKSDCVQSAFSSKSDCVQSAFWSWELEISQEPERAHQILNRAWLYWGAGINPLCLRADHSVQQKHALVAGAIRAADWNALHLLKFTAALPHRPTRTPPATTKEITARREELTSSQPPHMRNWIISLDSAMRQHHPVDAIWLLQAAWHRPDFKMEGIWTALKAMVRCPKRQEILEALMESRDEDERLYQTALVLYLCYSTEERLAPAPRLAEVVWPSVLPGRRGSRLFAVPPEALTTATSRGSLSKKYTTLENLQNLDFSCGTTFWQIAADEEGILIDPEKLNGVIFPSEDSKEAWFDRYFPDDLPDEWSAEEKAKSHGRCCGEKNLAPLVASYRSTPVSARAWEWGTSLALGVSNKRSAMAMTSQS